MADSRYTLLDYAKSEDPDGKQAYVYEIQNQINAIIEDAVAFPSNAPLANRVTLRAGLPVVASGKVNKGVPKSKATTEQRQDAIALVEGRAETDIKLRKVLGADAFEAKRTTDAKAWIEAIAQWLAQQVLYGDTKTDEATMDGLAGRQASLQTSSYAKSWVQDGGGGSARTSLYVVDWGMDTVGLGFPPGSIAGLDVQDLGMQPVQDNDNNTFTALVTSFIQTVGLVVKDPRHIARLANILNTDTFADAPTKNLINQLVFLLANMPDPGGARRVIYCHRKVLAGFYMQAINKTNAALSIQDYLGKPTAHFWTFPIRPVDQISLAESAVA